VIAGVLCLLMRPAMGSDRLYWGVTEEAVVGAVLGGIAGYRIDKYDGAVTGSILGAMLGSAVQHSHRRRNDTARAVRLRQRQGYERELQRLRNESFSQRFETDSAFGPGTAVLQPDQQATLDQLANRIKQLGMATVVITGHGNNSGTPYQNLIMSIARAEAVALQLVIKGVPRSWLEVKGLGQSAAFANNDTEQNRHNRRVDVAVVAQPGAVEQTTVYR